MEEKACILICTHFLYFALAVELLHPMKFHMLSAAYNVIVSVVFGSNDITSGSSPSASGIGSSSRTLSESKALRPANQAPIPSMHGNYMNNCGTISEFFILWWTLF